MPTLMTFRLKAARPLNPGPRQLHGLACALFEGGASQPQAGQETADPETTSPEAAGQGRAGQETVGQQAAGRPEPGLHAVDLHGADLPVADHIGQLKPFTVWPLQPAADACMDRPPSAATDDPGAASHPAAAAGREWLIRATWLCTSPPPPTFIAATELRLGHLTCAVIEITHRSVTHARLAAGPPLSSAPVTFHSPAFFSQNGSDVVLPDPRLIVGSWRRQWNAWAPADDAFQIDDDAWRELHRAVRITEFDLRTQRLDSGRGRERAGFTGTAVLRLGKDAPAPARARFGTLARFAEFCGTGAQTTHGFGATTVELQAR
jgi:CRISPR-associated endoribonuclease Cas6